MKLGRCTALRFGSYPRLDIDFSAPGLALIYGRTGSGKSTLPDVPCWALFGQTAKDGSADEVRSWQTPDEPTKVIQNVILPDGMIIVTRTRGKPSQNDLYWTEAASEEQHRGKDLKDTQRLLNQRLGVDAALYTSAAYFSEFSPTASFFLASAKDRRAIFERVASLDLPVRLGLSASEARKKAKADLASAENAQAKLLGRQEQLMASIARAEVDADRWKRNQACIVTDLRAQARTFDKDKEDKAQAKADVAAVYEKGLRPDAFYESAANKIEQELKDLPPGKCAECGALKDNSKKERLLEQRRANDKARTDNAQLHRDYSRVLKELEHILAMENHLEAEAARLAAQPNPCEAALVRLKADSIGTLGSLKAAERSVSALESRVSNLTRLYDLSFDLRGELLKKAVSEIEFSANRYLKRYFDAEITVQFSLDGDSLEVAIQKSGYPCVYSQLSKGQRGLLKLCFVVSVMHASANKAGVHFETVFFDEALDGLDSDLKIKAFSMLEELAQDHESVMVIDHAPEFQNLFDRRYHVELVGDASTVELENE